MKIAVTGATGLIGSKLVEQLLIEGNEVHALYRDENKRSASPHPKLHYLKGDITQPESLEDLMKGCDTLFHLAAFAGIWHRDERQIYRLNVEAALLALKLAHTCSIKRCVVTSSAAVFGPSGGQSLNENSPPPADYFVPYERSKAQMEKAILDVASVSPELILVNPSRLYGPGLLNEGNSVTRLIKMYRDGKWHFIPGDGNSSGNYAFIGDVVKGHILAMEKGRHRERYILGGDNVNYNEFFGMLDDILGTHHHLFHIPLPLMLGLSYLLRAGTRITGKPPAITPGLVRKYDKHYKLSNEKACRELSYQPVSLHDGLNKTIYWLNQTYPC